MPLKTRTTKLLSGIRLLLFELLGKFTRPEFHVEQCYINILLKVTTEVQWRVEGLKDCSLEINFG
jgi:hypothetical protein